MGHYSKRFFGQNKKLFVWYNFNGNTNDLASGLNGTLTGGATITNDRLNATTSGQYMQAADPTGIASFGAGAMTIACKVNVSSFASYNWIANKRDTIAVINGAKAEWQLYFEGRKLQMWLFDSSKTSDANIYIISTQTFTVNTTYHIAVTFSGGSSNTGFKMYVNGVLASSTLGSAGSYVQMRNNGSNLRLGNSGWGDTIPLKGWMDNFRLYNVELSASEIANLAAE